MAEYSWILSNLGHCTRRSVCRRVKSLVIEDTGKTLVVSSKRGVSRFRVGWGAGGPQRGEVSAGEECPRTGWTRAQRQGCSRESAFLLNGSSLCPQQVLLEGRVSGSRDGLGTSSRRARKRRKSGSSAECRREAEPITTGGDPAHGRLRRPGRSIRTCSFICACFSSSFFPLRWYASSDFSLLTFSPILKMFSLIGLLPITSQLSHSLFLHSYAFWKFLFLFTVSTSSLHLSAPNPL